MRRAGCEREREGRRACVRACACADAAGSQWLTSEEVAELRDAAKAAGMDLDTESETLKPNVAAAAPVEPAARATPVEEAAPVVPVAEPPAKA